MRIRLWGARGVTASSGPRVLRYGGNTPCVEVAGAAGETLVLDAGTGIIPLGRAIMGRGEAAQGKAKLALVLSHGHLDHLLGLPFFGPIYVPGNQIAIRAVRGQGPALRETLDGLLNPCYSPLYSLRNIKASLDIVDWDGVDFRHGGLAASAWPVPHGRSVACAVMVDEGDRRLAYIPDVHYPEVAVLDEVAARIRGAHTLVHDATFTREEFAKAVAFGHCTSAEAVEVALKAGVRRLILFHHNSDRDDAGIDAILADARALALAHDRGPALEVLAGAEGDELEIG